MTKPFKVGDTVRRIASDHAGMRVGDIATVLSVDSPSRVRLAEFLGCIPATHDPAYFELVEAAPRGAQPEPAMILSKDPAERKATPITTGVLDYFPRALAAVAQCSKAGNDQHNPGQPLHWAKGKSTDHADCIARHLIDRKSLDTDGIPHISKLAWRALALLETELEAQANANTA